jgi:hypothetical protein
MIKKYIKNHYELEKEFKDYNRENNFTRYDLIFNHFDTIEDFELDVIVLCCDLQEFSSIQEYNQAYNTTHKTIEDLSKDHFTLFDSEEKHFIVVNH